jgi:pimeloyl-ACP methyl ester carboxylesterase
MANGYQLPARPAQKRGREAEGFVTPSQDRNPQVMSIPPKRVIPIVFLPGIMGSNLRMSAQRQREMGKDNNIAWRPDRKGESLDLAGSDAATRQQQLDPLQTEVDVYDPVNNPTGDADETADERHDNVEVGIDTPLLMNDPPTAKPRKTKEQKARERGWGEVYFNSYGELLQLCEQRLNSVFQRGKLDGWWKQLVGVAPAAWQAHAQPAQPPLKEDELKQTVKGCWFPVHALGYNWLESNHDSGEKVAKRITALIDRYQAQGFQCEKVIVVTHSMGGLVARALIHPDMGNLQDKVLGIVHGVMPAIGAGAAYKRMRCGFEDSTFAIVPKVLGNEGDEVTAVLANAPGGLQLLPSQAYGNEWLQVVHNGQVLKNLPQKGDPYEEIYKLRGKWYGLLREQWINLARQTTGASFDRTCAYLDQAKAFHNAIAETYHGCSYAHYGADRNRAAWHRVVWEIDARATVPDMETLTIAGDNRQGKLTVGGPNVSTRVGKGTNYSAIVTLRAAGDPGDQTVPLHSADHQLRSGKFKGVFRQTGYEHQDSYKDERALRSTLYSLVRIAQTMTWSKP